MRKACRWLFESIDGVNAHQQRLEQQEVADLRRKLARQQEQLDRLRREIDMLHAMMPELGFALDNLARSSTGIQGLLREH